MFVGVVVVFSLYYSLGIWVEMVVCKVFWFVVMEVGSLWWMGVFEGFVEKKVVCGSRS